MDGLSSESAPEAPKPAEDTKDTKGAAKPKKPRVARKKPETLPPATADVPATAAAPPAIDAAFFGSLGSTLRDLKREARAQKISNFVVA